MFHNKELRVVEESLQSEQAAAYMVQVLEPESTKGLHTSPFGLKPELCWLSGGRERLLWMVPCHSGWGQSPKSLRQWQMPLCRYSGVKKWRRKIHYLGHFFLKSPSEFRGTYVVFEDSTRNMCRVGGTSGPTKSRKHCVHHNLFRHCLAASTSGKTVSSA